MNIIGSFDLPNVPTSFEYGYDAMGYGGTSGDLTVTWDLTGWDGSAPLTLSVNHPDWLGTGGLQVWTPPVNRLDDLVGAYAWEHNDGNAVPFNCVEAFELVRVDAGVHASILAASIPASPIPEPSLLGALLVGVPLALSWISRRWR